MKPFPHLSTELSITEVSERALGMKSLMGGGGSQFGIWFFHLHLLRKLIKHYPRILILGFIASQRENGAKAFSE
jgi:hypothetical protein